MKQQDLLAKTYPMKLCMHLSFLLLLTVYTGCTQAQTKPEIDYIITNDYMSERNISLMGGPVPAGYKKGLVDSLRNSFVEFYANGNLINKKYYNSIGALYQSRIYEYDSKNRVEKAIEIDEYTNDTCIYRHVYKDSLELLVQKSIINDCKKTNRLDFYYTYNTKGEETEKTLYENGQLYYRDSIKDLSKQERHIRSYDSSNRLSTYIFKRNEKDLISYEKTKKWDYVRRGEYFEVQESYEYLYKYDAYGNWTERIKQTYCPPVKKQPAKKLKNEPPKVVTAKDFSEDCEQRIKEKLIRKIYYK